MFSIFPVRPSIPFTKIQPLATVFSVCLVALGLWSGARIIMGKARVGTDFSGGLAMELHAPTIKEAGDLRSILSGAGFVDADIQEVKGRPGVEWHLRLGLGGQEAGQAGDKVLAALKAAKPGDEFSAPIVEEAGPAFSKKLQKDALNAVLVSFLGILIYVAIRFEFWFAVSAIVASFHDVFVTLGVISAMGYEFNLLIVSSLLILLGYSMNDTVVIFDRIRENMQGNPTENFKDLIQRSLNETLSRTIMTAGVTLLSLIVLYLVAGRLLEGFSVGLIVGISIGTYSSIFIAAPLVAWLRR